MHTVLETVPYVAAAKAVGLTLSERELIIDTLAANPLAGEVIPGTSGCRKLRFGKDGRGKSGGVRVVTFFSGERLPLFLITVFAKNERSDLTKAEANGLGTLTKILVDSYARRPNRS